MSNEIVEDLRTVAAELRSCAARLKDDDDIAAPLQRLVDAAVEVSGSWCGSAIGYHSRVYYVGFQTPPPGARFSPEWGFQNAISNETRGEWREYAFSEVVDAIRHNAGDPNLDAPRQASSTARAKFEAGRPDVVSALVAFLGERSDPLIEQLKTKAEK